MAIIGDAFKLNNRDIRWYFDKYLVIVCFLSLVIGLSRLSPWPGWRWVSLLPALKWLVVAAASALLTPRKKFILLVVLGFGSLRGIIGGVLNGSAAAVAIGVLAAVVCLALSKKLKSDAIPYEIQGYTVIELAMDIVVLLLFLRVAIAFT